MTCRPALFIVADRRIRGMNPQDGQEKDDRPKGSKVKCQPVIKDTWQKRRPSIGCRQIGPDDVIKRYLKGAFEARCELEEALCDKLRFSGFGL